jgi:hypothetical protein
MAGLVPAIHVFLAEAAEDVDARDICAKTRFALLPGHDGAHIEIFSFPLSVSAPLARLEIEQPFKTTRRAS